MYYFKVMELYSLGSHQPSYGILASVLESNACLLYTSDAADE